MTATGRGNIIENVGTPDDALESILSIFFGVLAFGALAKQFQLFFEIRRLHRQGFVATALVVDVHIDRDTDSMSYTPTVNFATRTGERRVVKACHSVGRELLVGSFVTVVYRPDDPAHAAVPDRRDRLLVMLVSPAVVGLGLALIILGLMGLGEVTGLPVPEVSFLDPPQEPNVPGP